MTKNDGSSDQSAGICEHVRAVLQKLKALQGANSEPERVLKGSGQKPVQAEYEEHGS